MSKFIAQIASVAAIALAALPVVAIGSAHAETRSDQRTAVIGVADLDFARPGDVQRFHARVSRAASKVCLGQGRVGLRAAAACDKDVRQQAMSRLGAQQLSRMAAAERPAAAFATAAN